MNIGLDFDDVIADASGLLSKLAGEILGVDVSPEQFHDGGAVRILTDRQYDIVWELAFYSERGLEIQPIPGMLDYLPRLIADHELRIVTSRGPDSARIAARFLEANGLALSLRHTADQSKAPFCTGLDVFVDDNIHFLSHIVHVVPVPVHFCHYASESSSFHKVRSWEQLYSFIGYLSAK